MFKIIFSFLSHQRLIHFHFPPLPELALFPYRKIPARFKKKKAREKKRQTDMIINYTFTVYKHRNKIERRMHNILKKSYTLKGTRVPNKRIRTEEKLWKISDAKTETKIKQNEMNSSIIHSAFALYLILTKYELLFFPFFLSTELLTKN